MAIRTNQGEVVAVLTPGGHYRYGTNLLPFIRPASRVIDRVATCAQARGITIDSDTLKDMETWYAAYLYTRADPTWKSKSTLSSSGSNNSTGNEYADGAVQMDPSGCLSDIINSVRQQLAGGGHLGRKPSERTSYDDYDPGTLGLG
jgi:hypothetical protein